MSDGATINKPLCHPLSPILQPACSSWVTLANVQQLSSSSTQLAELFFGVFFCLFVTSSQEKMRSSFPPRRQTPVINYIHIDAFHIDMSWHLPRFLVLSNLKAIHVLSPFLCFHFESLLLWTALKNLTCLKDAAPHPHSNKWLLLLFSPDLHTKLLCLSSRSCAAPSTRPSVKKAGSRTPTSRRSPPQSPRRRPPPKCTTMETILRQHWNLPPLRRLQGNNPSEVVSAPCRPRSRTQFKWFYKIELMIDDEFAAFTLHFFKGNFQN